MNMGYEIMNDRFHGMLTILRSTNSAGAVYLKNIPFEQWTQAYDVGLRYSHMISNLTKCINSVLKGTRHLPITVVVKEITSVLQNFSQSKQQVMSGNCREVMYSARL